MFRDLSPILCISAVSVSLYLIHCFFFSTHSIGQQKSGRERGSGAVQGFLLASSGRERKMKNRAPIQPRVLFFSRFHTMVGRQVWSSPDRQGVKKKTHACMHFCSGAGPPLQVSCTLYIRSEQAETRSHFFPLLPLDPSSVPRGARQRALHAAKRYRSLVTTRIRILLLSSLAAFNPKYEMVNEDLSPQGLDRDSSACKGRLLGPCVARYPINPQC